MIFLIIRIAIGALFVLSGSLKMTDLVTFHDTIEQFNILPIQYLNSATIFIPAIELICGIFLIINIFSKSVLSILASLLAVFTIAIGINLARGAEFDCGCFGPLSVFSSISISSIFFNVMLIGAVAVLYFRVNSALEMVDQVKIVLTYSMMTALFLNVNFGKNNLEYLINYKNVEKINWDQALELIETQDIILFDARPNERYKDDHVPGALSLPFNDFNEFWLNYSNLSEEKNILVYCDGVDCTASQKVANKIIKRGFVKVYNISEGWEGWKSRN